MGDNVVKTKKRIRETALPEAALKTDRYRILLACIINLLAVSTVFMTQSIFFELSESFKIDLTQARFSFSIVSLFYTVSFFFLGPAADRFDLPKMSAIGLILLSISVFYSSCAGNFRLFLLTMALMGVCAALIPASMFPHIAKISPKNKIGIYMGSIVASGTLGVIFGRVFIGVMTSMIGWQLSFRVVSFILFFLSVLTFHFLVGKNDGNSKTHQQLTKLYANSIRLLFNRKILSLLLAGFSLFVGFLGMVTFLTYRLIAPPFNFSSGDVGWISFAGITAIVAPFAGNLSQKVGTYKIIFPSLLICLLSFQLLVWFQSITLTALGILLLFLGVYACQPLLFLLIGQNVPEESIGSASSLYILFCIGGGSLSSIFLGPVWRSHGWNGITIICSVSLLISLFVLSDIAWKERNIKPDADVCHIHK